jgi:hypothetical protein
MKGKRRALQSFPRFFKEDPINSFDVIPANTLKGINTRLGMNTLEGMNTLMGTRAESRNLLS